MLQQTAFLHLSLFRASCNSASWHILTVPVFDVLCPALPLSASVPTSLQGALLDNLGEVSRRRTLSNHSSSLLSAVARRGSCAAESKATRSQRSQRSCVRSIKCEEVFESVSSRTHESSFSSLPSAQLTHP